MESVMTLGERELQVMFSKKKRRKPPGDKLSWVLIVAVGITVVCYLAVKVLD